MNCAAAPIAFSVWLLGVIVIAVKSRAPPAPPVATVRLAVPITLPVDEVMVAVIEVVPLPTAVATPEALTVATSVLLDAHVTPVVMFWVVDGCPLRTKVPVAVNWVVLPIVPMLAVPGVT